MKVVWLVIAGNDSAGDPFVSVHSSEEGAEKYFNKVKTLKLDGPVYMEPAVVQEEE